VFDSRRTLIKSGCERQSSSGRGYGHGKFWTDVEAWGFKEPLPFGDHERRSFWRGWLINEPPTIGNSLQDHIFLDEQTFEHVDACAIWDTKEVRELSDHGPVVVDLRLP
jgi:hypothetical protein